MVFRDPTPIEDASRALALDIARVLVRARELPVALPAFGLTLLTVQADRRALELVVGVSAPAAALRFEQAKDLTSLGDAPGSAPVRASVRALHPATAARYQRQTEVMVERVRASLTPSRWGEAWALGRRLAELPVGVPLGFYRQLVAGVEPPEALVRTGFLCNQDCGICWQDRAWGRYDSAQVLRWIEDLHAAGARALILSGGEPTLDPALERYVRHARALGYGQVTLETNAILCARDGRAEALRDAGLTAAFVSLHAARAEVSDAITRAPGTHARTVRGVKALLSSGVPVKLNAVMTQEGLAELSALPDFVAAEFGAWRERLLGLMFSYPTQPWDPKLQRLISPDPTLLRAELRRAIDRALALGLAPHGLDGPCGPQLCAFGADPRVASLRPIPEPVDFRRKLPACDACAVRHACFGVRDADVALYGDACVAPVVSSASG